MGSPPRAIYARQPPRGGLTRFVQEVWLQEAPADDVAVPPTVLAPTPSVDLIFSFADPFERLDGDGATVMPAMHAVGPRTCAVKVRATGRTGLVIARLHPWAARRLIRDAPGALVDGHIDYADVARPTVADAITAKIGGLPGAAAKIAAAVSWLEDLLGNESPDPLVVVAARRISAAAGAVAVTDLAEELGISDRQLRRRFRAAVGLSPKRFARIVRFQVAVGMLRAGRSWGDVVERCGFFDQAHLIGELQAMAGITPPTLQRRAATPLGSYFNSVDAPGPYGTSYL